MGPIGSGWPQIGFKFGFNPIMYLINPNGPDLNPILGRVGPPGSKFGLSRVGPPGFKFGLSALGGHPSIQVLTRLNVATVFSDRNGTGSLLTKLCNQVPSLSLSIWRTLTLLKI